MRKFVISFIVFILFSYQNYARDSLQIFLVKNAWHTGLILPADSLVFNNISAAEAFEDYNYIDFGWGDADFYQTPGFDIFYAFKAIFLPSSSVVRLHARNTQMENIIEWSDFAVSVKVSDEQFVRLCEYIDNSIKKNSRGDCEITQKNPGGTIVFLKSGQIYCLFNTCNTWAARALEYAGFDINPEFVVTAGNLLHQIKYIGEVLRRK